MITILDLERTIEFLNKTKLALVMAEFPVQTVLEHKGEKVRVVNYTTKTSKLIVSKCLSLDTTYVINSFEEVKKV